MYIGSQKQGDKKICIYIRKKNVKIDFIITLYLIFIALLNVFVAFDKTFAFANGIDLKNGFSYGESRGVSLAELTTENISFNFL